MASIEQDLIRTSRTSTPQYTAQQLPSRSQSLKHEDYGSVSRQSRAPRSASGTPTPMSNASEQLPPHRYSGVQNTPYFNSSMTNMNTAYAHMGYPELGSSVATPVTTSAPTSYTSLTDDSHHQQYLYATSAAATASQMVHSTPGSSPSSSATPHSQMVSYTTQPPPGPPAHHHQHHHQQHHQQQQQQQQPASGGHWMPVQSGGNTWNEWTNSMVDPSTQDRYSANALLTLGSGQRGPGDAGSAEMGVGGPGVPQGPSGQWPMLIFHPPSASGA